MAQTVVFPFLTPRQLAAPNALAFTAVLGNNDHALPGVKRVPSVRAFYANTTAPTPSVNAAPTPSITVKLYDSNNSSYISTPATILGSRQWQDSLNDITKGSISMPYETASEVSATNSMVIGRHLRFYLDGLLAWTGKITSTEVVEVGVENADLVFTVTCTDMREKLNRIVVNPSRGIDASPSSDNRTFSWHSPEMDTTSWPYALMRQFTIAWSWQIPNTQPPWFYPWLPPDGWPVADTDILTSTYGYIAHGDQRTSIFSKTVNVASDGLYEVWLAMWSGGALYIDGILVYETDPAQTDSWRSPWKALLELTAGDHTFAVKLIHVAGPDYSSLPGTLATVGREHCFAFNCHHVDSPNTIVGVDTLFFASDTSWKMVDNPATLPCVTPGEIFSYLAGEAYFRGLFDPTYESPSFDGAVDSDGIAWPNLGEFTCRTGDTMWQVIQQLQGMGYNFTVLPGGGPNGGVIYNLYADNGAGGETNAGLTDTQNLVSVTRSRRAPTPNTLICTYSSGQFVESDAAQVAAYGPIESFLSLGDIKDEAVARYVAQVELAQFASREQNVTVSLEYNGDKPYWSYRPGDSVLLYKGSANEERIRVITIDISESDTGLVSVSLDLSSKSEQQSDRIAQMVVRGLSGTNNGTSNSATPSRWLAPGGSSGLVKMYTVSPFSQGELVDVTENVTTAVSSPEEFTRPVRLTYISLSVYGVLIEPLYVLVIKNGLAFPDPMWLYPGENYNTFLYMGTTFNTGDTLSFMLYDRGAFDTNGGGLLGVKVWAAEASSEQLAATGRMLWE